MWDNSNLCQSLTPLQHLDKQPGTILFYIVFNRAPSQRVWPHMQPAKAKSLLAFMYSLRTQSKRQKLSQLGISGKQVSSHFILYKSKHTPGLGLRTMPVEWDAIHPGAQCKCSGRVCKGARLHVHLNRTLSVDADAAAGKCQMWLQGVDLWAH